MEQFIIDLVTKYPWFSMVCIFIGIFRLIFKPAMALVKSVIMITPSLADDAIWKRWEDSSIYKLIIWIVDYLLSIKLPGQK